ncbi:hypothetical protein CS0771_25800 [Catellatospora sp. IY07-71]|nr:hypothetical protein CS0771_25800 [Catellatospora sp. IY07-71]
MGVPAPSVTNRANAFTTTAVPTRISSTPRARTGGHQWAAVRHPVISQGARPATTHGAARKNAALPAAAVDLRTPQSHPREPVTAIGFGRVLYR